MSELNILLVGELNPELDNFLRAADSETKLIRRVWKAQGPVEHIMEQIRLNGINTVILNPLTGDQLQPVNQDATALISEVRRALPHRVAFVLYTDRSDAIPLLKQHSGLDVTHFINVDPALERNPDYLRYLRLALEKCKACLSPEPKEVSLTSRFLVALLLIVLYLAAIYATQDWHWLRVHHNRLGLYLCTTIITISLCLALLKREWQTSALTAGAFGALLVIAQII